jgi:crotonobetainyl-CoA:carnitine CoA-transferase CaiB-like acyl-CoA transferase
MLNLPLAGIKVIDASTVVMGPYGGQWLADLGAEVIKVETPLGDSTRFTGPSVEPGMSSLFLGVNRNKKSIVIDIKNPDGRATLLHLIAGADVFMHNIRPQKLAEIGLDPASVRKDHPRLVYASLHGFGQDGPYGGRPAYDDIIQGLSGNVAMMAEQTGAPRFFPTLTADKTSGLVVAMGIMAALLQRHSTGLGAYVEIPMFESMVAFNMAEHLYGEHFEPPQSPPGYVRLLNASRLPRKTADGNICLMPYTDVHWRSFFKAVGRPELALDARFATLPARTENAAMLYDIVGEIALQHSSDYWLTLCDELDIPAGRINTLGELKHDEHLKATGFFQRIDDPAMGQLRFPGPPVLFDGQRLPVETPPRLGADTESVLRQAGLSDERISSLLESGAVVGAAPGAAK